MIVAINVVILVVYFEIVSSQLSNYNINNSKYGTDNGCIVQKVTFTVEYDQFSFMKRAGVLEVHLILPAKRLIYNNGIGREYARNLFNSINPIESLHFKVSLLLHAAHTSMLKT